MVRLGQMEYPAFEKLRDEIVGGDVQNVHLVKGLDRRLLERVRRGEDVLADKPKEGTTEENGGPEPTEEDNGNVDRELDELENKDIKPMVREEKAKKGERALLSPVVGKKRTRDEILAEFRASRLATTKVPEPSLGSKFSKIGQSKQISRIECDDKGREVLITVDEQGKVKRKVKKRKPAGDDEKINGLLALDKDAPPLGMDVTPAQHPVEQEEENDDIFEGAGADYDPLADLEEHSDESEDAIQESKDEMDKPRRPLSESAAARDDISDQALMPPPPLPSSTRNYFSRNDDDATNISTNSSTEPSSLTNDPSLLAALKKASALAIASTSHTSNSDGSSTKEEAARLARRRAMLSSQDRDAQDLDMGFGASQFGEDVDDEGDGDGKRVKLSQWRATGGDDDDDGDGDKDGGGGGKQRKRGKKKRKGDKNSAADVLRVMEGRKAK